MLGMKQPERKQIDALEANVTYDKIIRFLESDFYKHWGNFVKLKNTT